MTTASEIRKANPKGKMTKVSGSFSIEFDNGVLFTESSSKDVNKLWNKLKRMGFQQHYNFDSDEFQGLAAANPKEVFNYTILTA